MHLWQYIFYVDGRLPTSWVVTGSDGEAQPMRPLGEVHSHSATQFAGVALKDNSLRPG